MEITFHGHACFELVDGDHRVLVDPFLKPNNPAVVSTADDIEDPEHILLTHGHVDHMADLVPIAKRSGAHCIAIVELAKWFDGQGLDATSDPNIGGTVETDWGWVKLVQALHTNTLPGDADDPYSAEKGVAIGTPTGLVINIGGTTVYHLGDTGLFGDMKLIAESTPVDIALVPIGGHYTMDRHDAVTAVDLIGPNQVVPMHYDTFPPIETDVEAFKKDVESKTNSSVVILKPGESHSP
jgi:L-ascorbate metabolism protein UlaG (beta-lactamase superfamily)